MASPGASGLLEQVRADRVQPVVVGELAGRHDRVDHREPGLRPVHHRQRDRAVQPDHRPRQRLLEQAVQRHDLRPVGRLVGGCLRVQRGDRRLDLVRPDRAGAQRALHHRDTELDAVAVPAGAVLVGERVEPPGVVGAGRAPRVVQHEEGSQAEDLRVVRQQPAQQRRQPQRLVAQVDADQRRVVGDLAGRVPLVEDQVHHVQDRGRALASSGPSGSRNGMPAPTIFFLARTRRWAIVDSGTRKALAISVVVRPPTVRRVSATCACSPSAGWQHRNSSRSWSSSSSTAAGSPRSASSSLGGAVSSRGRSSAQPQRLALPAQPLLLPAQPVQRLVARGGGQPRPGVGRDSVPRPGLQGRQAGVLVGVLGQVEVAEAAHERPEHASGLGPEHVLGDDRLHHPAALLLGTAPAQEGDGKSATGRTSIAPKRASGMSAASSRARSSEPAVDDVVAGEVLLALDERPVAGRPAARAHPHDRGRCRGPATARRRRTRRSSVMVWVNCQYSSMTSLVSASLSAAQFSGLLKIRSMYFIVASGVVAVVLHHRDERGARESTSSSE